MGPISGISLNEMELANKLVSCNTFTDLQLESLRWMLSAAKANIGIFLLQPERIPLPEIVCFNADKKKATFSSEQLGPSSTRTNIAKIKRNLWKGPINKPHRILRELMTTEFYQKNIVSTELHHSTVIGLISDNQYIGMIFLFRNASEHGFTSDDMERIVLLSPIIEKTIERILYKERSAHWTRVVNALDSQLTNDGIIIADQNWRVVYSNQLATELLRKLDRRTSLPDGTLKLPQYLITEDVQNLISYKEEIDISEDVHKYRKELTVTVCLLKISDDLKKRRYLFRLELDSLLVISEPNNLLNLGLTPRQIEIVDAVATGLTTDEMADKLHITVHTMNSHLKSIYKKLGVHNRLALLHKINNY